MPAHIFELLYCYYHLKGRLGRPPKLKEMAALMDIDYVTVRQRAWTAFDLGLITEPPRMFKTDWALFTDKGSEAFVAALDAVEPVIVPEWPVSRLMSNRDLMPEGVRYRQVSYQSYTEYLKALRDNGHATLQS